MSQRQLFKGLPSKDTSRAPGRQIFLPDVRQPPAGVPPLTLHTLSPSPSPIPDVAHRPSTCVLPYEMVHPLLEYPTYLAGIDTPYTTLLSLVPVWLVGMWLVCMHVAVWLGSRLGQLPPVLACPAVLACQRCSLQ